MTTSQLNAEMLRNMSIIAEDEHLLRRVTKYLRKVVAEKQADPTQMTKQEFFSHIDEAEREIKEGKGKSFANIDELDRYIRSI